MPDWKLEFILEYLKVDKNIENFKKINLFPIPSYIVGSEIPLLIDKIDFLKMLKEHLKGYNYIDHRRYIENLRRSIEEEKEKLEIVEYLAEADYA